MAYNIQEQFSEAAKRSQSILVALPHAPNIDQVAGALALATPLRALGKNVEIVADGFTARPEHKLLTGVEDIKRELGALQHFLITIPIKNIKLRNLVYTTTGDELKITLTPESQNWTTEHVKAAPGNFRYDLAITIGAPDMEALGSVYRDAPEFWKTVPILNIDHSPANEHYGAVNLVDIHAAAVSEIVYDILKQWNHEGITKDVATTLLTGVIGQTNNFRTEKVSPKTLTIAADLVQRGAAREQIVSELYRTKNIETLRLWGRTLARLRTDSANHLAWALLTQQDFIAAGAKEEDLNGVLEDVIGASPEISTSFILHESDHESIRGVMHTHTTIDLFSLCKAWQPEGSSSHVTFTIPNINLVDAERIIIEKIKVAIQYKPQ